MDNRGGSDEINFETRNWKVYQLSAILILSSLIQWLLLANFECFAFLLNYWLLLGAYITFLLIAFVYIATDLSNRTLPAPLKWLFAVLITEIINIALGIIVRRVNHLALYSSLAVDLIFLIVLLAIGRAIKLDYLPVFFLTVFSCNMLFIILILILMMIARFLAELYMQAFLTITTICFIILIINTLYISILLRYDRQRIPSLTSCLTPALHIHALFGAYVWFSLSLAIEIGKIRNSMT